MFKISLLSMFVAAALAQPPGRQIMGGTVTLKSGLTIRYRSMLVSTGVPAEKAGLGLGTGGMVGARNGMHRVMIDGHSGTYFGYELVLAGDEVSGYLATLRPPGEREAGFILQRSSRERSLKPMPLPAYPPPILVHDGDMIALDLMVSPDGKQRLTDYIEVFAHKPDPPPATTTAEPRDFTVDDGPVVFDPMLYTIWIQGQKLPYNSGSFSRNPGATFWIGFPGQGRYILSLAPHDGFIKAGTIRDHVLSFRDGGQEYEVRFMSPIAGAGKAWNLYMLHDSSYEPKPNQRGMVNMGTDRLENLLPKQ